MLTEKKDFFSEGETCAKNQDGLEKLTHEIALQVPINIWCPIKSFAIAWYVINAMTDFFGGTTIALKPGTYKTQKGFIVDLSIWIVSSTSDAQFECYQVDMINLALKVRRTLKQDCVCLKVDRVLEFH